MVRRYTDSLEFANEVTDRLDDAASKLLIDFLASEGIRAGYRNCGVSAPRLA